MCGIENLKFNTQKNVIKEKERKKRKEEMKREYSSQVSPRTLPRSAHNMMPRHQLTSLSVNIQYLYI